MQDLTELEKDLEAVKEDFSMQRGTARRLENASEHVFDASIELDMAEYWLRRILQEDDDVPQDLIDELLKAMKLLDVAAPFLKALAQRSVERRKTLEKAVKSGYREKKQLEQEAEELREVEQIFSSLPRTEFKDNDTDV